MKAAQIINYGDASVIQINESHNPTPAKGQVLVEVHSSSLNPFDTSLREGYMKDMIPLQFPATLGGDIAGVVLESGEDVTNFAAGDKVYGQAAVVAGNSGALAELAATAAAQIAQMPKNLDFDQAASLPLAGVSALQALTEHIKLAGGQKVFIHGGAGGIGTIAIQIAKHLGGYVATTAAADDADYVKQLGADQVVDRSEDFSQILSDFDAVFDTVGGDDFNKALGILKPGGVAVSMIAPINEARAKELGVTAITQRTQVTTERLDKLSELVESGAVKPQVGAIYSLEEIAKAFAVREAGGVRGKIVIKIK